MIGTMQGGTENEGEEGVIFSGYTVKDGKLSCFLEDGRATDTSGWAAAASTTSVRRRLYSMFGSYRIEPTVPTEMRGLLFTYEKDESFQEIGYYHNTSGEWDRSAAEELQIPDDAFWQIMQDYEEDIRQLDMTPFSEYVRKETAS
jgi:hypothetical protein